MEPRREDTIVALSSAGPGGGSGAPAGDGWGRVIARLSGPRALACAEQVFTPEEGEDRGAAGGWRRLRGAVRWRSASAPAVLYVTPAPHSYTRQDVVELHLPANWALAEGVIAALLAAGARPAAAGEFTRRAFLNGRLTLSQAEEVNALICSGAADQARAHAARLCRAAEDEPAGTLRKGIEDLLARAESAMDFSREEVEPPAREEFARRLRGLMEQASRLAGPPSAATEGLRSDDRVRVALVGPPNAGKSTLCNALLGREAALVSPQPHTTRDCVIGACRLTPGLEAQLADTAGLADCSRSSPAALLLRAAEAAARAARSADLLLVMAARDQAPDVEQLRGALDSCRPAAAALVPGKADLPAAEGWEVKSRALVGSLAGMLGVEVEALAPVCARSGEGMAELREWLARRAGQVAGRIAAARSAAAAGGRAAGERCRAALVRAMEAWECGPGEDAAVVELREARLALAQTQGLLLSHDRLTERLLDRIFADFCLGK